MTWVEILCYSGERNCTSALPFLLVEIDQAITHVEVSPVLFTYPGIIRLSLVYDVFIMITTRCINFT